MHAQPPLGSRALGAPGGHYRAQIPTIYYISWPPSITKSSVRPRTLYTIVHPVKILYTLVHLVYSCSPSMPLYTLCRKKNHILLETISSNHLQLILCYLGNICRVYKGIQDVLQHIGNARYTHPDQGAARACIIMFFFLDTGCKGIWGVEVYTGYTLYWYRGLPHKS